MKIESPDRHLSQERTQIIRDSVAEGVNRVVKPLVNDKTSMPLARFKPDLRPD